MIATSPSQDGKAFFYTNTLHQRVSGAAATGEDVSPRASSSLREPWFDVSCCPTNIARTLATWHTYAAAVGAGGLSIAQYASESIQTRLEDGREIGLDLETDYPVSGRITIRVSRQTCGSWILRLRIPAWADGAELHDRGETTRVHPGFAQIEREFTTGEVIVLELPMTPRFTVPSPNIDAVRGCVAVERGPEVMCLESVDLPNGITLAEVRVNTSLPAREVAGRVLVSTRCLEPREDPGHTGVPWSGRPGQGT
ncbi:MAG TPA: hypothetical protein VIJ15_11580 [Dermatophilaceae bacterium]